VKLLFEALNAFTEQKVSAKWDEMMRQHQSYHHTSQLRAPVSQRFLSYADLGKQYRPCGRTQVKKLIASGELPVIYRLCRGGRMGAFFTIEDAERVLAGKRFPKNLTPGLPPTPQKRSRKGKKDGPQKPSPPSNES
jgi:hypothetical protein